jgi:hypothetical protein
LIKIKVEENIRECLKAMGTRAFSPGITKEMKLNKLLLVLALVLIILAGITWLIPT